MQCNDYSEADPFDCVLNFTVKDFAPGGQAQGDKRGKGGLSVEMTTIGSALNAIEMAMRVVSGR